ncbi:MAG: F0F1 ATP synthase subunit B [Chloroflexi bacterium]|nr:F0F1 ATP synthase subunit B [Chloroflexota bacterium]
MPLEALGINLPGLIAQIVNFSLLLFLLSTLLYRPILKALDERSERIRESLGRAEAVRQEASRAESAVQARLDDARREAQAIVAQATQIGERMKEEARQEALRQAEALLVRARGEIDLERDRAISQLRRDFAELTILAAGKVIGQQLDRGTHERLIEQVLAESGRLRSA